MQVLGGQYEHLLEFLMQEEDKETSIWSQRSQSTHIHSARSLKANRVNPLGFPGGPAQSREFLQLVQNMDCS